MLVCSGPGATNTVTGIATAYMDSIPMIVISGNVATNLIGNDAFQECDIVGVSRPIVKHSFLVKKAEDIPETIKKAFYIASTGRPGPVVIDVPKDVMSRLISCLMSIQKPLKCALTTQRRLATKDRSKRVTRTARCEKASTVRRWRGDYC